jgi:hypothetical protein
MTRENLQELPNMLVTAAEAAEILRISPNQVGNLINAGLLPCLIIGSRKIRIEALNSFIEKWDGWDLSNPYEPKRLRRKENTNGHSS